MDTPRFQELYEAAFDARDPHRLAQILGNAFGGRSAILHLMPGPGQADPVSWSYFSAEIINGFRELAHLDPWTAVAPEAPRNTAIRLTDHVSTSTFQHSAFYNEFVRPNGDDTSYCLGAVFPVEGTLGALGVHRGAGQGDFEDEHQARLERFMPHLVELLTVRCRLEQAERKIPALEATLDTWPRAILHVDQQHRVAYANGAAEALLKRSDPIRLHEGKVTAAGPHAGALQAALDDALRSGRGSALTLSAGATGQDHLVTVAPLYSPECQRVIALVSVDTVGATDASMESAYMAYFGLTKAEAEIAAGLANGMSLEEISAVRQTQIWTARTQLRTILQKTGARRQAQLVAMLKGLPHLAQAR